MALPAVRSAVAGASELAPERRTRRPDATLVEASVTARLFGMRLLTLDAAVVLVPADARVATPPVPARGAHVPARPLWDPPGRSRGAGHRLADAVRTLDEGARVLADVQRNGP